MKNPPPWIIVCNQEKNNCKMSIMSFHPPLEKYPLNNLIAHMDNNNKFLFGDAKLIAAAPYMYDACCHALALLENEDQLLYKNKRESVINILKCAIKEAEEGHRLTVFEESLLLHCSSNNCSTPVNG